MEAPAGQSYKKTSKKQPLDQKTSEKSPQLWELLGAFGYVFGDFAEFEKIEKVRDRSQENVPLE